MPINGQPVEHVGHRQVPSPWRKRSPSRRRKKLSLWIPAFASAAEKFFLPRMTLCRTAEERFQVVLRGLDPLIPSLLSARLQGWDCKGDIPRLGGRRRTRSWIVLSTLSHLGPACVTANTRRLDGALALIQSFVLTKLRFFFRCAVIFRQLIEWGSMSPRIGWTFVLPMRRGRADRQSREAVAAWLSVLLPSDRLEPTAAHERHPDLGRARTRHPPLVRSPPTPDFVAFRKSPASRPRPTPSTPADPGVSLRHRPACLEFPTS